MFIKTRYYMLSLTIYFVFYIIVYKYVFTNKKIYDKIIYKIFYAGICKFLNYLYMYALYNID